MKKKNELNQRENSGKSINLKKKKVLKNKNFQNQSKHTNISIIIPQLNNFLKKNKNHEILTLRTLKNKKSQSNLILKKHCFEDNIEAIFLEVNFRKTK